MTHIEVMKQALDSLLESGTYNSDSMEASDRRNKAITALRQAIAQAEQAEQEPVAWRYKFVGEERWQYKGNRENLHALCLIEPLYTLPPKREETDDEIYISWLPH